MCAQVFNALGGNTWSSLAKLRGCIGDVSADTDNPLMEAEMKRQQGGKETGEVRAHARVPSGFLPSVSRIWPRNVWG